MKNFNHNEKNKVWKLFFVVILLIAMLIVCYQVMNKEKISELVNGEKIERNVAREKNEDNYTGVMSSDGIEVPVPTGYVASGVESEKSVNGGFVIYEGTEAVTEENLEDAQRTRNQWVWIPVNDPSRIYKETNGVKSARLYNYNYYTWGDNSGRSEDTSQYPEEYEPYQINSSFMSVLDLQGKDIHKFNQELQIEFDEAIESIKTYGGFYIGRYETGNISQNVPVVQKLNEDINNQTWYELCGKMKYLGANISVKTNMIWDCLWDETLQWLLDNGSKTYEEIANDSTGWGNFASSTFSYTTKSEGILTKSEGSSIIIPTGSTEYTKVNNIYDIAGNMSEFTLSYMYRSDAYNVNSNPDAGYKYKFQSYYSLERFGVRAYMYIK